MESVPKKQRGPRLKDELDRKVTCSLTLTGRQKAQLEALALAARTTPSLLIVKRFKLK